MKTLSPAIGWLLEQMRTIGFGRIEGLRIRNGQPVRDPIPRISREIKLGSLDQQTDHSDYLKRPQVRELLALFDKIDDGVIDSLEIHHGIPFKITISNQPICTEA